MASPGSDRAPPISEPPGTGDLPPQDGAEPSPARIARGMTSIANAQPKFK
jgi:hypothetical protein